MVQCVLKDRPYLDSRQVHVKGRSYSGGLVAYLASRYSQHFRSGIILNGTLEWGGFYWSADTPEYMTTMLLGKQDWASLSK